MIVVRCKFCGDAINTLDMRRTVCDSKDCKIASRVRTKEAIVQASRNYQRRIHEPRICCECGQEIPYGSRNRRVCHSEKCQHEHSLRMQAKQRAKRKEREAAK